MRLKFKMKSYHKLSKATRTLIRKRSTHIALRLPVLHTFLGVRTESDMDSAIKKIQEEVNELLSDMNSPYWGKYPRKEKKKLKKAICNYFNAYSLIPELATFIISIRDEKESNQAQYCLYRTWAYLSGTARG